MNVSKKSKSDSVLLSKTVSIDPRIEKVLVTKQEVDDGCIKAAQWINKNYKNKSLLLVGILKGCITFMGRLIPLINLDLEVDFMTISSFRGHTHAVSAPKIVMDLSTDVKDYDVLLVEDIIDAGYTTNKVIELLKLRGAKSIGLITFLDKYEARKVNVPIDYACYQVPDKFVVGFGIDYQEKFRNLPYIGYLKKAVIEKMEKQRK